jgi:hypothetical protein
VNFLGLGASLKLFFKFQGPNYKIVDYGSITEMHRGSSIKFLGILE